MFIRKHKRKLCLTLVEILLNRYKNVVRKMIFSSENDIKSHQINSTTEAKTGQNDLILINNESLIVIFKHH